MDKKKIEAGRKGGKATVRKYGPEHMREIGREGARVFHKRYRLQPVRMNDFAIVRRSDDELIGFISGT